MVSQFFASSTNLQADMWLIIFRGALSAEQRIDYTNAVLCLQSKKANTPSELVPGAKSRFDDFITTHINQTYAVHQTVSAEQPAWQQDLHDLTTSTL